MLLTVGDIKLGNATSVVGCSAERIFSGLIPIRYVLSESYMLNKETIMVRPR